MMTAAIATAYPIIPLGRLLTRQKEEVFGLPPQCWASVYRSWICYAVLIDITAQVAVALRQPLERISVEMVFRSFYHFSRARQQHRADALIPFLVQYHQSFGLLKAQRKRHRQIAAQSLTI